MTTSEWLSLQTGSVVSNLKGKNCRVVIKWDRQSQTITLLSNTSRNRRDTVYCRGDKYMFRLVPIIVRLKFSNKKP